MLQGFNAYSPRKAKNETAPVYVNFARQEDLDLLYQGPLKNNLNHLMIARYGKISAREKVKNAIKYGAEGLILFPDPELVAPYGTSSHNVYPYEWWLPGTGVIRETILPVNGDPQSPGWPSIPNVHKVSGVSFTTAI